MDFDLLAHPIISWAFGGIGITVVGWFISFFLKKFRSKNLALVVPSSEQNHNEQSVNLNIYNGATDTQNEKGCTMKDDEINLGCKKNSTKILFIDDEVRFKVVKILQRAGWVHTKLIKDAESLDQEEIKSSHIIFVDIQGVGLELTPKEEGLGLASALKQKYPEKKIIIYSAEQTGDRFHEALREVDDFLPKDADPYQFQRIVEDFA
ncbi:hypothetical protein [Brenneria uluponensis]|uniref:hypothetical protein n=1 Tax=Brenneria uluponensis TaxID=3057057 RepID=UPI0028E5B474|nr:hypothetical protein [Brenneria ulupoensis]